MRKAGFAVFVTLLAGLAPAGQAAVAAQPDAAPSLASPAEAGVYSELYDTIKQCVDKERLLDQLIATFSQQLATGSPDIVKAEALYPGYSAAISESIRPLLRDYRARIELAYRPRMIAALKELLTESEARDAINIYVSPVGRKLAGGVSTGFDGKATVASALRGDVVDQAAVDTDRAVAVTRAVNALTPSDLAELERLARAKPGMMKLGQLGATTRQLSAAMENEPLTAAEETEMGQLMEAAARAHLAKFDK